MMRRGFTFVELLIVLVILCVILACAGAVGLVEIPFWLTFGWIPFVWRTVPDMSVSWPAIGMALVTLVLFTGGLHVALPRAVNAFRSVHQPLTWHPRWTLAIVGVIVLMFVAGIGLVGVTHQVGWLATSGERWFASGGRLVAYRTHSRNNLRNIALAMHDHDDTDGALPVGTRFDATGRPLHSWQTSLLPYLDQQALFERIDHDKPWNDPANAEWFAHELDVYLNPAVLQARTANEQPDNGYAASHYAASSRLFGGRAGQPLEAIADGQSNTILGGEITERIPAWGQPLNVRDPALGIGPGPQRFHGPWQGGGVQFLMADGSARFLSANIDPDVLRALATPDGGEDIAAGSW